MKNANSLGVNIFEQLRVPNSLKLMKKKLFLLSTLFLISCNKEQNPQSIDSVYASMNKKSFSPGEREFGYVVIADSAYYLDGPWQGRSPDGSIAAGTKVKLIKEVGSYQQVLDMQGKKFYISSNSVQKMR
ncbi:MAG: hypothetical protein KC505_02070 [Myxococcales bacterium]|nr:hypothetical protein [Myxococcales bacterium]USN49986.1 MAG: hypothetical protein H6731_06845 [Myxococcales bacterium]